MSDGVLDEPSLCYPLHCTQVKGCLFWCDGRGRLGQPCTVLPPPCTAPRLDAACFGAMGVGGMGDAFLCYPPPRLG